MTKPSHCAFFMVCGALFFAGAARAAEVPNASFEEANPSDPLLPLSWEHNAWGGVMANFAYPATGAKEGAKAVRIEVTSATAEGDAKWWSAPFAPEGGAGRFDISDYYRGSVPSRLLVYAEGGGNQEFIPVVSVPAATEWTLARGRITLPTWTETIRVLHVAEQVGWLELDLVAAKRLGTVKTNATVTFTFDDGWMSAYRDLIPKMNAKKIRGTHFIITRYLDDPKYQFEYMGSAEVKALLRAGHEVASHTLYHEDMKLMSSEVLGENLTISKAELERTGAKIVGIAPPFGSYSAMVLQASMKQYAYVRSVRPGINLEPYEASELLGTVVDDKMQAADVMAMVDDAKLVGGWVVLVFHRSSDEPKDSAFVRPSVFEEILNAVVASGADIRPMGEVLGVWQPTPIPDDVPPVYPHDPSDEEPIGPFAPRKKRDTGCALSPPSDVVTSLLVPTVTWMCLRARRRRRSGDVGPEGGTLRK